MNRFVAIVALLSFAAFGDAPGSVTKTRLGSLHPREGLVVTDIDLSSIGGGITTNDVCNIVTNDVVCGFSDWEISGEDYDSNKSYDIEFYTLENHPDTAWPNFWKMQVSGYNEGFHYSGSRNPDAIDLSGVWESDYGFDDDLRLSVVRKVVKSNALGLARLADLPPLTNGLARTSDIPSTAADVGALPVNNTDETLNFGILYGEGITLGGAHYYDDYPGRVGLKPGTASFFGAGLEVKGRISLTKNSEFPEFGNGELLVNGTNVMDAIAAVDAKVENAVLPTNPSFSNAVLSVGLNIDTNSVAVLNEIAATFGGFPIEGTATTVGGLLAALAAAVAWLKKNKADKASLDDLAAKVEYPLYAVPSTGILKDRALNTTSLASVTVPANFTDLLIRASVASSLSVTMPEAITKYGDTFPGEAGEYLITITKTGTSEAYVRTIKLEVANA